MKKKREIGKRVLAVLLTFVVFFTTIASGFGQNAFSGSSDENIALEEIYAADELTGAFIRALIAQTGKGYILGNNGPDYYDCTSLIEYCLKQIGFVKVKKTGGSIPGEQNIPETTAQWHTFLTDGSDHKIILNNGTVYKLNITKNIPTLRDANLPAGTIIIQKADGWYGGNAHASVSLGSHAGDLTTPDYATRAQNTMNNVINSLVASYGIDASYIRNEDGSIKNTIYGTDAAQKRMYVAGGAPVTGSDPEGAADPNLIYNTQWRIDAASPSVGVTLNNEIGSKVPGGYVDYAVSFEPDIPYGEVRFNKTGKNTQSTIANATWNVYSDEATALAAMANPSAAATPLATFTTDANGSGTINLPYDDYFGVETTAPVGTKRANTLYVFKVKAPTATEAITNEEWSSGSVIVRKVDQFGNPVPGATIVLQEWDETAGDYATVGTLTEAADGSGVHTLSGYTVRSTGTAVNTGKVYYTESNKGKFKVLETVNPDGYTGTFSQEFSVGETETTFEYTATNTGELTEVEVYKKDSETKNPLSGAKFGLYTKQAIKIGTKSYAADERIEEVVTNGSGYAKFTTKLPHGGFYVKEVEAPVGYEINTTVYDINFTYESSGVKTFTYTCENKAMTGVIEIEKQDKVTGTTPRGEGQLSGAEYGLYAAEDIYSADGVTKVYAKDSLIHTFVIGDDLKAVKTGLLLGKYYVQETKPSSGYLLDQAKYSIDLTTTTKNTPESNSATVFISKLVKEEVIERAFSILKLSDDGSNDLGPLKDAGFTAYPVKTLVYLADGKVDYVNSPKAAIGANGETELFTNANGELISAKMPYGEYLITESTVPKNHYKVADFYIVINGDDTNKNEHGISVTNIDAPKSWRFITNEMISGYIKIVKRDADTDTIVAMANTEFKIFDVKKNAYVTQTVTENGKKVTYESYKTTADGTLLTPKTLLAGTYRLEEVNAPEGYTKGKDITITIDSDYTYRGQSIGTMYDEELDTLIIPVDVFNKAVTGEITLSKEGEVLVGYDAENQEWIYEVRGLAGTKFDVIAAEDIYTADHQTDAEGNRILYTKDGITYAKDTVIATLTTDMFGKASLKGMPLGEYRIVETEAPEGYLSRQDIEHTALLEYAGQSVAVVYDTDGDAKNEFFNDRPQPVPEEPGTPENPEVPTTPEHPNQPEIVPTHLGIGVYKYEMDKEGNITDIPVEGTVFNLYNKTDIYNVDGELIVEANTLLGTATTNAGGLAVFAGDFAINYDYYVVETEVPDGFILDQTPLEVTYVFADDSTKYILVQTEQANEYVSLSVSKKAATGDDELEGAKLKLTNLDTKKVIEEWISGKTPHIIDHLVPGEYELEEITAPYGYDIAAKIVFTIEETGEIQPITMIDEMWMDFSKVDVTTGKEIPGADMEVEDPETNEIVDAWTSTTEDHRITGLTPGKEYILRETTAPFGYEITEEITFIAKPGDKKVMKDAPYQEFIKTDFSTSEELDGALTQVIDPEDESIIDEWISEAGNPHRIVGLITGKTYIWREITAPEGYEITEDIEFVAEPGKKEVMKDKRTQYGRIAVIKTGERIAGVDTLETKFGNSHRFTFELLPLANVEFTIYADEELTKVAGKVTTSADGLAMSEYLRCDTYYVKETATPAGYATDNMVYEVELKPTDDGTLYVLDVTKDIVNHVCGVELNIHKVGNVLMKDANGFGLQQIPLAGVFFGIYNEEEITDADGNVILPKDSLIAVLKSNIEGLASLNQAIPAGNYYYKELQTLEGFALDTEKHPFAVELGNEANKVIDINKDAPLVNDVATGKLIVRKTDGVKNPLKGVEFTVTNQNLGTQTVIITDDKGIATITDLPIGGYVDGEWMYYTYVLQETKGLDGYLPDHETYNLVFTQREAGQSKITISKEVVNRPVIPIPGDEYQRIVLGVEDASIMLGAFLVGAGGILAIGILVIWHKKDKRSKVRKKS